MKNIILLYAAFAAAWLHPCLSYAQQTSIPLGQIVGFHPEHPGYFPESDFNRLSISYLSSDLAVSDWKTSSQFLRYASRPQGNFSWGLFLANDIVHTEQRFSLSPSISARIIDKKVSSLSAGISLGFVNWNSNYNDRLIYDPDDPAIPARSNFLEVDAGLGASYRLKAKKMFGSIDLFARQLTGNMISADLPALRIVPHIFASGSFLVSPVYNVIVGPRAFLQTAFNDSIDITRSQSVDLLGVVQFKRQHFEVSGGYRPSSKALIMGFQLSLKKVDTLDLKSKLPFDLSMNFATYFPMGMGADLGPSAELGIGLAFRGKDKRPVTLHPAFNFWSSQSGVSQHLEKYLPARKAPQNLKGYPEIFTDLVYLTYEFNDNSGNYLGDGPIIRGKEIQKIGDEWIGVDLLLEYISNRVIPDALFPDSTNLLDPENLEPLKALESYGVRGFMRESNVGMHFGSEVIYEGELGFDSSSTHILSIDLVVNERDTTVQVVKGQIMTKLELAALKLHIMNNKLWYELKQQFGNRYYFVSEEQNPFGKDDKKPDGLVTMNKPRLISDNLNQKPFLLIRIEPDFSRFTKH